MKSNTPNNAAARPTLLYFTSEDWIFCLHRLGLACAARDAGYDVAVVTRVREHAQPILDAGLRLIPLEMVRGGLRPWQEIPTLWRLYRIYRREQPQLVHHVALKPVLYGSLVAWLAGVPAVVNALTGLGFIYTSQRWLARLLRLPVGAGLRLLLNRRNSRVIFENNDDLETLAKRGTLQREHARLIRGSGVDVNLYTPLPEPSGVTVVILAARLLWDKGVGEFVAAARLLKARGVQARFALVGGPDPENPAAIAQATLDAWRDEGAVELWGWRNDMLKVFADCHIVCLPSYREGLPRVLLEAAACARPVVATDVEGCREAVVHERSGYLVPVRHEEALADALAVLIAEPARRAAFGAAGREIVCGELSLAVVIARTFDVYNELRRA